jgi:hypothetical protein
VTPADLREIIGFLSEMERLTWTEVHAQITSSKRGSHRKLELADGYGSRHGPSILG